MWDGYVPGVDSKRTPSQLPESSIQKITWAQKARDIKGPPQNMKVPLVWIQLRDGELAGAKLMNNHGRQSSKGAFVHMVWVPTMHSADRCESVRGKWKKAGHRRR